MGTARESRSGKVFSTGYIKKFPTWFLTFIYVFSIFELSSEKISKPKKLSGYSQGISCWRAWICRTGDCHLFFPYSGDFYNNNKFLGDFVSSAPARYTRICEYHPGVVAASGWTSSPKSHKTDMPQTIPQKFSVSTTFWAVPSFRYCDIYAWRYEDNNNIAFNVGQVFKSIYSE
jgi:hypothetical protein